MEKNLWYSVERMVVAKMKEERPHLHLVAGKLSSHGSLCQQTSRLQSVVSNLDINNFLRIRGSSDDHMWIPDDPTWGCNPKIENIAIMDQSTHSQCSHSWETFSRTKERGTVFDRPQTAKWEKLGTDWLAPVQVRYWYSYLKYLPIPIPIRYLLLFSSTMPWR